MTTIIDPESVGKTSESDPVPPPPEPPLFEQGDRVHVTGRGLGYVTGVTAEGRVYVSLDQIVSSGGFGIGGINGTRDHVCVKPQWLEKVRP